MKEVLQEYHDRNPTEFMMALFSFLNENSVTYYGIKLDAKSMRNLRWGVQKLNRTVEELQK